MNEPRDTDFLIRKIVLPSGKTLEVIYFGTDAARTERKEMEEYVEQFVDGLNLDLITPEDFGS